jgi:hypothetical protein
MQGQEFTAIKMVPGAAIVVRIPTDAVALTLRTIPLSPAREFTATWAAPGVGGAVRIPTDAVALTLRTIPLSPARESTNTDPSASEFDT